MVDEGCEIFYCFVSPIVSVTVSVVYIIVNISIRIIITNVVMGNGLSDKPCSLAMLIVVLI
jgi:hypothetical protein